MRIVWDTFLINSFFLFLDAVFIGAFESLKFYFPSMLHVFTLRAPVSSAFAGPYEQIVKFCSSVPVCMKWLGFPAQMGITPSAFGANSQAVIKAS